VKLPFRPNPKTHGWPKRAALSLLTGITVFLISLPVSFLLFLNHDQHAYPNDPQNLLSALTASVALGLALAACAVLASFTVLLLWSLRSQQSPQ